MGIGRHQLVCIQGATGKPQVRWADVIADKALKISFIRKVSVTVGIGDGVTIGGRFYRRGQTLELTPRRVTVTVKEGDRSARVHLDVSEDCVIAGQPIRCQPRKP